MDGAALPHLLARGLDAGWYTAASALLWGPAHPGDVSLQAGQTLPADAPDALAVAADTPFDLASLTKPLATLPCTLFLVGKGEISLDTTVRHLLGRHLSLRPFDVMTIANLLSHTAGFIDWAPLYRDLPSGVDARAWFKETILGRGALYADSPGVRRRYSDLDYLLLGVVLEQVAGQRLDELFSSIFGTLIPGIHFRPPGCAAPAPTRCPATCSLEDGRLLQGVVHDDNARALGGVAGHAGLFGAARDVALMARTLSAPEPAAALGLDPVLLRQVMAVEKNMTLGVMSMGFDIPDSPRTTAGPGHPQDCIGHLGFTGTSLWFSPCRQAGGVLLTNRALAGAPREALNELRSAVHDLAWQT